jgi:cytochrome c5
MSEHHTEEHKTFIKTPQQLLAVIILAFLVPIIGISILASLASHSVEPSTSAKSQEVIAQRLKPVGQVVVAEGSDVPGQQTGKQVVEAVCSACHATGALGAPKIGDAAAWAPLVKDGQEHLTQMALKGIRAMPPKGGNPQLTDAEVARAVAFMANQAGANFKEPPVEAAAPTQVAAAGASPIGTAAAAPAPAAGPAGATSGGAAGGAAGGTDKGKSVFEGTCMVCHGTGVAGAPKMGDKSAWAPRVKQGMDTLHQHALKGFNAMPPKGGNMSLSDADVMAAVDYMASQAK